MINQERKTSGGQNHDSITHRRRSSKLASSHKREPHSASESVIRKLFEPSDRNYTGRGGKGSRKRHVLDKSMTLRIPGAKTLERHRGHSRLRTRPRQVSSSSRSGY